MLTCKSVTEVRDVESSETSQWSTLEERSTVLPFGSMKPGVTSECTARCLFRLNFLVKPFPHLPQMKGFSPVWVLWCMSREHFWMKALAQCMQRYGFSPVCVRWCVYRWPFCAYLLPHSVHLYGFSPVWLRLWISSWLKHLKHFAQRGHTKRFSSWNPEATRLLTGLARR